VIHQADPEGLQALAGSAGLTKFKTPHGSTTGGRSEDPEGLQALAASGSHTAKHLDTAVEPAMEHEKHPGPGLPELTDAAAQADPLHKTPASSTVGEGPQKKVAGGRV
jgi:hypothetical protein